MTKSILAVVAFAFVAAVAFKPVPAQAWVPFIPLILESKKDPNFKSVNPYAPVKAKKAKSKKR